MTVPPLHPELTDLGFLLGTWVGSGVGEYPTIEDFAYQETAEFTHVGKPFIAYRQKTKRAGSNEPLHAESGYFRPTTPGSMELVIVQPSGILEIHDGAIDRGELSLRSSVVLTTPTAKEVSTVERWINVEGDVMTYRLLMGAVGQPHQIHLRARLNRTG